MISEINTIKEYFLVHRIGCPWCNAKPNELCKNRERGRGEQMVEPHKERMDKALEEEDG